MFLEVVKSAAERAKKNVYSTLFHILYTVQYMSNDNVSQFKK